MRIIGYILLILPFTGSAQELVDSTNFDIEVFNKYVLKEVNKLRTRNRLDTLTVDPSLGKASQDHCDYMTKENVLSHIQKNKYKNSPFDRVKYYGGAHSKVGENIQLLPLQQKINKSKGRLTYDKLAKELVSVWKKSSGHYKNIINPHYTGVYHSYVVKNGMLFCCQLLASKPFVEGYDFQKGDDLFVKDKRECLNCRRTQKKINKDQAHMGWYDISNDSVYYVNSNFIGGKKNNLKKIFGARGIITVDLIHQEQFDCSGNPSFHNSLYYDGYYIGYVNKASLNKDLHPSPNLVKIYVGQKPAFADTFFQVDFNLVKRYKPCLHGMIIYVNPDFLRPQEYFEIPTPTILGKNIIITDSIEVKIPFKSGQTNEDTLIFIPLITTLDSLVNQNYGIKSIYFNGIASIEGTENGNQLLFNRRGAIIRAYLKRYYPTLELKSEFYENFDDFRIGLVSIGMNEAIIMSEDSLRSYANLNKSEPKVSVILDNSRYSEIRITFEDVIPLKDGGYGLSVKRLQDLINKENYREMVSLYEVLAHRTISGEIDQKDSLLALSIPDGKLYGKLHWYEFIVRLNLVDEKVDLERLSELVDNGAIPSSAEFLEYRLMFNIFNGTERISIDDFGEVFPQIRAKRDKAWVECLELISGVQNYRYSDKMVAPILLQTSLKKKFNLKQTYFICQYLIDWGYTTEPYILLSKFAKRPGQLPKLYKQYLKLGYFLGQFNNKKEWKKIKNVFKSLADNHPEEFCDLFRWSQMGVRALDIPEIADLFCQECREAN
jgi:uncharacterized protein YkwD